MKDQFNRSIEYMRISITDRCNLNCQYCRPENSEHLNHSDILSYEEILRVCTLAVKLGITKFKITGGEPFVRHNATDFIKELKNLYGVDAVTVTTNGTLLDTALVSELVNVGIDGINISLDTMNPQRFAKITGKNDFDKVIRAIKLCADEGLNVKVNMVLLPDVTEKEVLDFLEIIKKRPIAVRFIETMPMNKFSMNPGPSGEYIRTILKEHMIKINKVDLPLGNGPAVYYKPEGYEGYVGFIEAIHGKFCGSCNRIRLTSTGFIKPCLYHKEGFDIRQLMQNGCDDSLILQQLRSIIYSKPLEHDFEKQPAREDMSRIGG